MTVSVKVTRIATDWKNISGDKVKNGLRAVNRGALAIHAEVVKSFVRPKSGLKYKRGSVTHTSSAPGEAPARDTGHLGQSTSFKLVPIIADNALSEAHVSVAAEYALALEFGHKDGSVKARPFLRPAWNMLIPSIRESIAKAMS